MGKQGLKLHKYLSIAFALFFGITQASDSNPDTCSTIERTNQIININETRRTLGDAVRVVRVLELENSQRCKEGCCNESDCSVYVFYNSGDNKGSNCYLVTCRPIESCVFNNLTNSVVGIRTLNDENHARQLNNSEDSSKKKKTTAATFQKVTVKTTESSQSKAHDMNATSPFTMTPTETDKQTTDPTIQEKHKNAAKNHTTVASLIIALFFGILFLFAVVILIGQPWWNSFHRPLYSKVDYLMNGL